MDLVYSAADFAVGRAGATFLAEIAAKKIPAILIPYPFADGHQLLNARVFARNYTASVMEQSQMSAQKMAKLLEQSVSTLTPREKTENYCKGPVEINARQRLADFVMDLLKEKR
jgi:UDP-N-acetylglucosamine--N-acetylmuramyl-(pentapeptide) pyrophosphoryl-undecaprenol N-acetylglucosamine transferase